MEKYDVIVVGGSVAGAPTATWLARKGYKVLIIERAVFPRDTNSTHFIWPRGMSYLNRLGVAKTVLQKTPSFTHLEVCIEGISLRGCVPLEDLRNRFQHLHGNANGVVDCYAGPRRYFLDQVLLDEAKRSGVHVREATNVKSVIVEDGVVKGVRAISADGGNIEVGAKVVIGADGRFSRFADFVGARKIAVREKSTFAYYGWFSGIAKDELAIHKRGRFGTAIFPTMDDKHLVLVYGPTAWWESFGANAEENFLKTYEYVEPSVAELVRKGRREEPFKAMGRMVAFHRENWGDGWALIGDAGSFKDQWTAMGITHSLRDAELISEHIDHALSGKCEWSEAMLTYASKRLEDYELYWDFVCDGAECKPYTREQLEFFYKVSRNQDSINHFIAQVGDTVKFREASAPPDIASNAIPASIRNHDPSKLDYETPPFVVKEPEANMQAS